MNQRSSLLNDLSTHRSPLKTLAEGQIKKLILDSYFKDYVRSEVTGYTILTKSIERFNEARISSSEFWRNRAEDLAKLKKEVCNLYEKKDTNFKEINKLYFNEKIENIKLKEALAKYNNMYQIVLPENTKQTSIEVPD